VTGRLLLASIHDVGPRFEAEVDALAARLDRLLGGPRFAMLVVADHWDEAPLHASSTYARRLRDWADAGVEMFVHGWSHRDAAPSGFAARHMTAGEGEFSAMAYPEALARMRRARAVVEDATGRAAAGSSPPPGCTARGRATRCATPGSRWRRITFASGVRPMARCSRAGR